MQKKTHFYCENIWNMQDMQSGYHLVDGKFQFCSFPIHFPPLKIQHNIIQKNPKLICSNRILISFFTDSSQNRRCHHKQFSQLSLKTSGQCCGNLPEEVWCHSDLRNIIGSTGMATSCWMRNEWCSTIIEVYEFKTWTCTIEVMSKPDFCCPTT